MASRDIPSNHYISELGLRHWVDKDVSYGEADIIPEILVPGTGLVRIGVLATFADVVAGQPPSGAVNPTTDLSVHVGRQVEMKTVHLESRVIKSGATLAVMETRLTADTDEAPFATSLATFMNRRIEVMNRPQREVPTLTEPVDSRIGAHVLGPGRVELMPRSDVANMFHGTVQGGVLALLGELAAASTAGDSVPFVVTDLDVRFLNRVRVGPVVAEAEVLVDGPRERRIGVHIRDQGDDHRTVAYVAASGSA